MSPLEASIQTARRDDPQGHLVHVALACLHLFTLPLTTAGSAITFIALLVYALIRLPKTGKATLETLRQPLMLAAMAWIAWTAISIAWSPVPAQGLDELRAMRMLLLPILLAPIIECAPLLIIAACIGVLTQNLVQAGQVLDLIEYRIPGRYGGLIHPIQAGAWCIAALCFHALAILRGRGALRWISLVLALVAAAGLIATGSRGPWIAAGLTGPLLLITVVVRRAEIRKPAVVLALAAAVLGVATWFASGDLIRPRIDDARAELRAALDYRDYGSSTGARIAMWSWGWGVFVDHPIAGVGAGAYLDTAMQFDDYKVAAARPGAEAWFDKDHPHSSYLHVLATTGVIGGAIFAMLLVMILVQTWRRQQTSPWSDAAFFVAASWIVGAQFDTYHLNGHLLGMLGFVMALALPVNLPGRFTFRSRSVDGQDVAGRGMSGHWNRFAQSNAMYYIATEQDEWSEDEFFQSGKPLAARILNMVQDAPRGNLLEIGCGLGRTSVHYAREFDHVDAVDIASHMIEKAKTLDPPDNIDWHVSSGDGLQGFDNSGFDVICSALVFQHIPEEAVIENYLREIARTLRPDGMAAIQFDTRPDSLPHRLYKSLPDVLLPRQHRRFIRRYRRDPGRLRAIMSDAGLAIVEEFDAGTAEHFFLLKRNPS